MVNSEIEIFSFPNWYTTFERDSIEAVVINVPNDVLEYLKGGSVILPIEATPTSNHSDDWGEDDDSEELQPPTFPKFSEQLKDALNCVGGIGFVKSNWHAAKDASWITTGRTLKCSTIEDVYLLLKGSDIICKDMNYEFQNGGTENKHCIVVKRWIDFHPGCEYRCFVKDHSVIAISQRDCSAFYPHINARKYDIVRAITNFFKRKIKNRFLHPDYVVDIVKLDDDSLLIIDFQPFDKSSTNSLLFKWEELTDLACNLQGGGDDLDDPEFRYIGENPGLQPNPCKISGMPFEVQELCTEMRDSSLMEYLLEEVRRQDSEGT